MQKPASAPEGAPTPPTPAILPKFTVQNWTNSDELEVSAWPGVRDVPKLINLIAREGSLYMQHGLTPTQAREMAGYLLTCADALEPLQ